MTFDAPSSMLVASCAYYTHQFSLTLWSSFESVVLKFAAAGNCLSSMASALKASSAPSTARSRVLPFVTLKVDTSVGRHHVGDAPQTWIKVLNNSMPVSDLPLLANLVITVLFVTSHDDTVLKSVSAAARPNLNLTTSSQACTSSGTIFVNTFLHAITDCGGMKGIPSCQSFNSSPPIS